MEGGWNQSGGKNQPVLVSTGPTGLQPRPSLGLGGGGGGAVPPTGADQMIILVKDEPSELFVRTSLKKCRVLISFVPD